ncbi:hypothetical protein CHUAL_000686 [Chamberlinius hualienensis]
MLNFSIIRPISLVKSTLTKFLNIRTLSTDGVRIGTSTTKPSAFPLVFSHHLLLNNCKISPSISKEPLGINLPCITSFISEKSDGLLVRILPLIEPLPSSSQPVIQEPAEEKTEIHCARMIKIRRRKMRKHKRKKRLRKNREKIKTYEENQLRLKHKAFESRLFADIDAAEAFNPEEWVNQMVHKSFTSPDSLYKKWGKTERPTKYVFPAHTKRR